MSENETRYYREADQLTKEDDQLKQQAYQAKLQQAKVAVYETATRKLESRVMVGISYVDYSALLGETVHQVRGFWKVQVQRSAPLQL